MKLLPLLLLLSLNAGAQKDTFKWPKPLRDSQYTRIESDTLHGTIEYSIGAGRIIGNGIIVTNKFIHYNVQIYSAKDQAKIDAYRKTQMLWASSGGYSLSSEDQARAYIKTLDGWRIVLGQYTLYPSTRDSILQKLLGVIYKFLRSL